LLQFVVRLAKRAVGGFIAISPIDTNWDLADCENQTERSVEGAKPRVLVAVSRAEDSGATKLEGATAQCPTVVASFGIEKLNCSLAPVSNKLGNRD
jgi:hypothetical protein